MKYFITKLCDKSRVVRIYQKFELRYRNIWSQSTKNVFEEYKKQIDATNPYSFYRIFTNQSKRTINVLSLGISTQG